MAEGAATTCCHPDWVIILNAAVSGYLVVILSVAAFQA
jgi:hypothetical protein